MKPDTPRSWFYVPNCEAEFLTMDQCVKVHGSGMLVARHTVLDELEDLKAAFEQMRDRYNHEHVQAAGIKQLYLVEIEKRQALTRKVNVLELQLALIGEGGNFTCASNHSDSEIEGERND